MLVSKLDIYLFEFYYSLVNAGNIVQKHLKHVTMMTEQLPNLILPFNYKQSN